MCGQGVGLVVEAVLGAELSSCGLNWDGGRAVCCGGVCCCGVWMECDRHTGV
jgi:hypothetical protein